MAKKAGPTAKHKSGLSNVFNTVSDCGAEPSPVTVWHDITERERLLEELRKSKNELESNVRKRTFELEQSRAELRKLAASLQKCLEEERLRLARELHDEIGQALTFLKINMGRMVKSVKGKDLALFEALNSNLTIVNDTINWVRNMYMELRPYMLYHFGFIAALSSQCNEFQKKTGIKCKVTSEEIELDPDISLTLYRVVQEALANVALRAGASRVNIGCHENEGFFCLTIEDNGKDISENEFGEARSTGLLGIRERMLAVNGSFEVCSRKNGKGTRMSVKLPLKQ
jgi:two-component system, NarL family, sensor histidine kinase UhpB